MKILVVDDSKIIRDRLVNLLDAIQGVCVVEQAENAENALLTYHKLRPEVLILDVRIRGPNGIEVLKQVKSEQHAPYVIMLTNFPYPPISRALSFIPSNPRAYLPVFILPIILFLLLNLSIKS